MTSSIIKFVIGVACLCAASYLEGYRRGSEQPVHIKLPGSCRIGDSAEINGVVYACDAAMSWGKP